MYIPEMRCSLPKYQKISLSEDELILIVDKATNH